MADLPDLSGDPKVRAATLAKVADTTSWLVEVGEAFGVSEDELERMREDGARTYRAVRAKFELDQAAWN